MTGEGIQPTNRGLEAITKFPAPRNICDVQSFLRLCSYFRKFVKNFSILAKLLYDLSRENTDFKFAETERQTFEILKEQLTSTPILSIYSPRDETELHCDASAADYGAILMQKSRPEIPPYILFFKKNNGNRIKISQL